MEKIIRVSLVVPEEFSAEARRRAEQKAHEAAVLSLLADDEITTSKAAEELGLSIHDMLDLMAERGIPAVRGGFIDTDAIDQARRRLAGEQE